MADALAAGRTEARGYLVEEQQRGGIELIVGVVRHPLAGPLVLLGMAASRGTARRARAAAMPAQPP